jgi:hypothetical protein
MVLALTTGPPVIHQGESKSLELAGLKVDKKAVEEIYLSYRLLLPS